MVIQVVSTAQRSSEDTSNLHQTKKNANASLDDNENVMCLDEMV